MTKKLTNKKKFIPRLTFGCAYCFGTVTKSLTRRHLVEFEDTFFLCSHCGRYNQILITAVSADEKNGIIPSEAKRV